MKLVVIGTGYVGLVQGACLAHLGHEVVCVDINKEKVEALNRGEIPIYEEGLSDLVAKGQAAQQLSFTTDLSEAVAGSRPEAVFVCVQTPMLEDGKSDLSILETALRQLGQEINATTLVVVKSTVPPGTRQKMLAWLGSENIELAVNPEFLRQGTAVRDFLNPERIVIGADSAWAKEVLTKLHEGIEAPVMVMSVESAQLSKYTANAMLALRLSFMNEIANIADAIDGHVLDVEKVIGSDSRIGSKFLRSGAGFGGSCFPKDVLALHHAGVEHGYKSRLVAPIIEVNNDQPKLFVDKIRKRLGDVSGMKLAVWGLAFNKGTDDVRESPAVKIVELLVEAGAKIMAFDPQAQESAKLELGEKIGYADSQHGALENAEALLVLTEWPEFATADWAFVKEELRQPVVFDGKNFLPHQEIQKYGLEVHGMGLCPVEKFRNNK